VPIPCLIHFFNACLVLIHVKENRSQEQIIIQDTIEAVLAFCCIFDNSKAALYNWIFLLLYLLNVVL